MGTESERLRREAAEHERKRAESIKRSGISEGFVSQWAHSMSAEQKRVAAELEEAGGVATFARYELETTEGEPVPAKVIEGRYGECWAILEEEGGKFTGEFAPFRPARESTLARRGYREKRVEFVAPARAVLRGARGARGLGGAASVRTVVVPAEGGTVYHEFIGVGEC